MMLSLIHICDAENHPPMIVSAEDAVKEKALGCIAYAAHQKVLRKFRFDDATTFAETHGGGGGGSDLKWGRDEDEDNRAWARRCMRMASRMMRPRCV